MPITTWGCTTWGTITWGCATICTAGATGAAAASFGPQRYAGQPGQQTQQAQMHIKIPMMMMTMIAIKMPHAVCLAFLDLCGNQRSGPHAIDATLCPLVRLLDGVEVSAIIAGIN